MLFAIYNSAGNLVARHMQGCLVKNHETNIRVEYSDVYEHICITLSSVFSVYLR